MIRKSDYDTEINLMRDRCIVGVKLAYCHKMQYCLHLEAVFASEIKWTDVLNARRWKQRSKKDENA